MADSLAIGCLLAGLRGRLHRNPVYLRLLSSRLFVAIPCSIALFGIVLSGRPRISYAVGETITIICIGLCIDWCVTFHTGRVGQVLNWRPMVKIGILSYSIYLWQQLFMNRETASIWTSFPLNIILTAGAALASYYVIEEPALGLRRKWEKLLYSNSQSARGSAGQKSVGSTQ